MLNDSNCDEGQHTEESVANIIGSSNLVASSPSIRKPNTPKEACNIAAA
jgi:hypothetical protein